MSIIICLNYHLGNLPGVKRAPSFHEVDDDMAKDCVIFMDEYSELEEEVENLQNDQLMAKLVPTMKKMELFMKYLGKFQNQLKKEIAAILVKIRSGHKHVDLEQLIERIENKKFAFNPTRLRKWLLEKHKELDMVKKFCDEIEEANKNLIASIGDRFLQFPVENKLQDQEIKKGVKFAFNFVFTSLTHPEPILEQMRNHTKDKDAFHYAIENAPSSVGIRPYWYSNDAILQHIQKNIVVFNTLINHKKSKDLAFAITALEEAIETENVEPGSTIFVYKEGNRQENKEDATQYMIEHYPKDRVAEVHGVYAHHILHV